MAKRKNVKPTLKRTAILKAAFERLKLQNPSFSLRALAAKLECSPAFLSKVLSGKAELPRERVKAFVKHLKLDTLSEKSLWESYLDEEAPNWLKAEPSPAKKRKLDLAGAKEIPDRYLRVLEYWYYVALLDLSECVDFEADPEWVAERLSISAGDARASLEYLKANGYLVEKDGRWKKSETFMRIPALESKEAIRNFQEQMLKKCIHHFKTALTADDYKRRLISGFMVPANPANLERAKMKMHEAMMEVVDILNEGPATELYYFADILFPLTKVQAAK